VSDRLFTLLVFLHIGVPLALLLGMFVHIQRVNFADVAPARALGWGTLAALIALSLVKPATSMPPADLASAPQMVPLDWFYLALYPLLYEWSGEGLWMLAVAATIALLALPWVVRGAPVPAARVDPANCNGCGRCFADCPYAAVVMRPRPQGRPGQPLAMVLPGLCAGCGICTGACPSSTPFRSGERLATGIDMPQQPIDTVRRALERELLNLARGDSACASSGESLRRIVVFGCDQGAQVTAVREPGVAAFSLLCIGMLPPAFVEYALRNGADGVLVAACREGECAYRLGERWLRERLSGAREPHLRPSVPRERVRFIGAGVGEEQVLQRELAAMRAALWSLPRNVRRPSSRDRKAISERSHAA
jgi:coenzyme F420-reducing hydrogenase delta subunit/ferredoxin